LPASGISRSMTYFGIAFSNEVIVRHERWGTFTGRESRASLRRQ
jgi:hypothetical protein